ncbi:hypothetical protein Jiend_54490 [Micromonospora endophytica]|nr:hypothetical protein Jiend_54490 [Micromonospora endophytica]
MVGTSGRRNATDPLPICLASLPARRRGHHAAPPVGAGDGRSTARPPARFSTTSEFFRDPPRTASGNRRRGRGDQVIDDLPAQASGKEIGTHGEPDAPQSR